MLLIFLLHLSLDSSSRDNFDIQSSCFPWLTKKSTVGHTPYYILYYVHFTHTLASSKLSRQAFGFILRNGKVLKCS